MKFPKPSHLKHRVFEDQGSFVKIPKKKTITLSKAKKKAWHEFSIFIRTRDARLTTGGTHSLLCFTCDKPYPAFGLRCAQAGHFIVGRHAGILFDERGVHGQCYNCNVNLKGNSLVYFRKMQKMYGDAVIEELERLNKIDPHYKVNDYLEIYEKYKTLNKEAV